MKLLADRAEVSVPGSIAGLGSGFHVLAVAVGPPARFVVRAVAGPSRLSGAGLLDRGADPARHGAVQAVGALLDRVGAPQVGVHLQSITRIPPGAGLGAFAADVATGLLAARTMLGSPPELDTELLVDMAVALGVERIRARVALVGGASLGTDAAAVSLPVSLADEADSLVSPVAFVPAFVLDERRDRDPLPSVARYVEAQESAEHLALQVALLAGSVPVDHVTLMRATGNAMIGEQLSVLSPSSAALAKWLREQELPAFVTGAGPAVVSLAQVPEPVLAAAERSGWDHMPLSLQPLRSLPGL